MSKRAEYKPDKARSATMTDSLEIINMVDFLI